MKVTGDSSHNFCNPQIESHNQSIILHKTQKNTITVYAKLIHSNFDIHVLMKLARTQQHNSAMENNEPLSNLTPIVIVNFCVED